MGREDPGDRVARAEGEIFKGAPAVEVARDAVLNAIVAMVLPVTAGTGLLGIVPRVEAAVQIVGTGGMVDRVSEDVGPGTTSLDRMRLRRA